MQQLTDHSGDSDLPYRTKKDTIQLHTSSGVNVRLSVVKIFHK